MHSGLVVLDEAHAAHVGGEVVDLAGAGGRRHAASSRSDRSATTFSTSSMHLVPLVERLDVDGADALALAEQVGDEVAADEAAAAGDDDVDWSNRHVEKPTSIALCPQAALTLWSEHGSMVRTRNVGRGYGPPARSARSRPTLAPVRDQQRRTVLITGVTGQDGIYLSRLLLSRGHHVVGAAPPGAMPPELCAAYLADVDLVPLDICDRDDVQRVIDTTEPDEVYNLAAVSSVARSWDEPEATFAVNHAAVETLVRALLELRGRTGKEPRFFQASSAEVTGSAAHSPYAQAKAAAEEVVREARDRDGLHACSARLYNHESPLRTTAFVTGKITRGVAEIAAGQRDELRLGNLDVSRDWGFAGDYVDAMCRMVSADEPLGPPGRHGYGAPARRPAVGGVRRGRHRRPRAVRRRGPGPRPAGRHRRPRCRPGAGRGGDRLAGVHVLRGPGAAHGRRRPGATADRRRQRRALPGAVASSMPLVEEVALDRCRWSRRSPWTHAAGRGGRASDCRETTSRPTRRREVSPAPRSPGGARRGTPSISGGSDASGAVTVGEPRQSCRSCRSVRVRSEIV